MSWSKAYLTDSIEPLQIGVPRDIGWAVAVLRPDFTVTRWCKSCGVVATSPVNPLTGRVQPTAILHQSFCTAFPDTR